MSAGNPAGNPAAAEDPAAQAVPLCAFTVGHSRRTTAELIALLEERGVDLVIDVRAIPYSRTNPQFNVEVLPKSLAQAAIGYRHLPELGGRRRRARNAPPSANTLWRNDSFRNYADYAGTDAFKSGFTELLHLTRRHRGAVMCSEALWWRCHRRIIADYLLTHGTPVLHILGPGKIQSAVLTPGASRTAEGTLVYPAA
ncbi:MAG: DUF488 domain-containing protein [Gammaproteobacteria bacterium]|nr:DUF488 domain-containing protein [Gammaproteobacteria bacterium]